MENGVFLLSATNQLADSIHWCPLVMLCYALHVDVLCESTWLLYRDGVVFSGFQSGGEKWLLWCRVGAPVFFNVERCVVGQGVVILAAQQPKQRFRGNGE
jgi:hypothetical protein